MNEYCLDVTSLRNLSEFFINNMKSRKSVLEDAKNKFCVKQSSEFSEKIGYKDVFLYGEKLFVSNGGDFYSQSLATYMGLIKYNEFLLVEQPNSDLGRSAKLFLIQNTPFYKARE